MRYLPGQWAMFPPIAHHPSPSTRPSHLGASSLAGGSAAGGCAGRRRDPENRSDPGAGPWQLELKGCGALDRVVVGLVAGWGGGGLERGAGREGPLSGRPSTRQRASDREASSIGPSIHSGTAQQPRHSSCQLPARGSQLLPLTVPASIQRSKRPSSEAANRQAGGGKAMDGESRTNGGPRIGDARGLALALALHWRRWMRAQRVMRVAGLRCREVSVSWAPVLPVCVCVSRGSQIPDRAGTALTGDGLAQTGVLPRIRTQRSWGIDARSQQLEVERRITAVCSWNDRGPAGDAARLWVVPPVVQQPLSALLLCSALRSVRALSHV